MPFPQFGQLILCLTLAVVEWRTEVFRCTVMVNVLGEAEPQPVVVIVASARYTDR